MFTDEFYSYDIKSNGKRVTYNLDSDPRYLGKFCGYDVAELFAEMISEDLKEVTLTITLKRYPEEVPEEC